VARVRPARDDAQDGCPSGVVDALLPYRTIVRSKGQEIRYPGPFFRPFPPECVEKLFGKSGWFPEIVLPWDAKRDRKSLDRPLSVSKKHACKALSYFPNSFSTLDFSHSRRVAKRIG
jgi:hypothetical protein